MLTDPILAVFVGGAACEAALTGPNGTAVTLEFPNTDAGIDQLLQWARTVIGGKREIRWVTTVPVGDGGVVYEWLHEEIPEVFLQNPAALKEYASKAGVSWDTALALHDFNRAKQW